MSGISIGSNHLQGPSVILSAAGHSVVHVSLPSDDKTVTHERKASLPSTSATSVSFV